MCLGNLEIKLKRLPTTELFFCSAVEENLFVSDGTRACKEQPFDDYQQTWQGMANLSWGEAAQLRVARVRLRLAPHHQEVRGLGLQIVCQDWRQNACPGAASYEGSSGLDSVERNSNLFEKRPQQHASCWSVVPDRNESDLRRREIHILHPDQRNDRIFHNKRKTRGVFQHQRLCFKPLGSSSEWNNQKFECWK